MKDNVFARTAHTEQHTERIRSTGSTGSAQGSGPAGAAGRRRRAPRVLAAAAAFMLLTGPVAACRPFGGDSQARASASPSVSAPSAEDRRAAADLMAATAQSAGPDATPVAAQPLPVLESRKVSIDKKPATVALNSVTVANGMTTVLFTVTNDEAVSSTSHIQIGGDFDDGDADVPLDSSGRMSQGGGEYDTADGVTVTTDGQTLLRAAYDSAGHCLCSSDLGSVLVDAGQSTILQASFAALPDSATTATVTIPQAGTFTNVAVSR